MSSPISALLRAAAAELIFNVPFIYAFFYSFSCWVNIAFDWFAICSNNFYSLETSDYSL